MSAKIEHEKRMEFAYIKRKIAAFLILKHGYTNAQVLQKAFGVNAKSVQNSLYKWSKSGFIKRVKLPLSHETLIMLPPESASKSAAVLGIETGYNAAESRIASRHIPHTIAVQLVAIDYAKRHGKQLFEFERYFTEPRLNGRSKSLSNRGDLHLHDNDLQVLVEVELTQKSFIRNVEKLTNIVNWQFKNRFKFVDRHLRVLNELPENIADLKLTKCEFHCSSSNIVSALENAFERVLETMKDDKTQRENASKFGAHYGLSEEEWQTNSVATLRDAMSFSVHPELAPTRL